jgi:hypothetical protein
MEQYYDKEKTLVVHTGIMVHNQEQYLNVVSDINSIHSVANKPKTDKKGIFELDAFPFIVDHAWLPQCGYHIRCRTKMLSNRNYVEFK